MQTGATQQLKPSYARLGSHQEPVIIPKEAYSEALRDAARTPPMPMEAGVARQPGDFQLLLGASADPDSFRKTQQGKCRTQW